MPARPAPPRSLPFTGDDESDRLLAEDPFALLVGFALDQQVPVQKAFRAPLLLRQRLGTLDPAAIAARPDGEIARAFAGPPALHRFPQMMARRVAALAAAVSHDYGGDAAALWRGAADGRELAARLRALPGFGPMKVAVVIALLGRQFGVRPRGWEQEVPGHPTLGEVTTPEELLAYQAGKRQAKATRRQAGPAGGAADS